MSARGDIDVAAVQITAEQCWSDPEGLVKNTDKVQRWYEGVADDVDLVVFPELVLSGYIPLKGYDQRRKRILADVARRATADELPRLADATRGRRGALVFGFMESSVMRNEIYNSLALLEDGEIRGVYRKIHLPVEENHYFVPGNEVITVDTRAGRIALSICYDAVFPEIGRMAALQGAELIVSPSNWLDISNLRRLAQVMPVARALEGQMHVVFVNGVGELEVRGRRWSLFGSSALVSATGEVIKRAGDGEEVLRGSLAAADLEASSDVFPLLRDRRPDVYAPIVSPLASFTDL